MSKGKNIKGRAKGNKPKVSVKERKQRKKEKAQGSKKKIW